MVCQKICSGLFLCLIMPTASEYLCDILVPLPKNQLCRTYTGPGASPGLKGPVKSTHDPNKAWKSHENKDVDEDSKIQCFQTPHTPTVNPVKSSLTWGTLPYYINILKLKFTHRCLLNVPQSTWQKWYRKIHQETVEIQVTEGHTLNINACQQQKIVTTFSSNSIY